LFVFTVAAGNPINERLELGHTAERLEEQEVKGETMKQEKVLIP